MAKKLLPKGFLSLLKKIGESIYQAQGKTKEGLLSPISDESGLISPMAATPEPTPTATSTVPYQHHIPTGNPNIPEVPQNYAQDFMEVLGPSGLATDSARMVAHKWEQTFTPTEQRKFGARNPKTRKFEKAQNWNYGENPGFDPNAVNPNPSGSQDIGMTMQNTDTFNEMMANPVWKNKLKERGVTNVNQLKDVRSNLNTHLTRMEYGNWDNELKRMKNKPNFMPYFAAPLDLRMR